MKVSKFQFCKLSLQAESRNPNSVPQSDDSDLSPCFNSIYGPNLDYVTAQISFSISVVLFGPSFENPIWTMQFIGALPNFEF